MSYELEFAQKHYNVSQQDFFRKVEHELVLDPKFDQSLAWKSWNDIQDFILEQVNNLNVSSDTYKYSVEFDTKVDDSKISMISNLIQYYIGNDQEFKGRIVRHFSEDN